MRYEALQENTKPGWLKALEPKWNFVGLQVAKCEL